MKITKDTKEQALYFIKTRRDLSPRERKEYHYYNIAFNAIQKDLENNEG